MRLLGAAQDALAAREDLHRHHRVELLGGQDRPRALEVHVGGLAGEDVGGGQEVRRRAVGGHGAQCTSRAAGRGCTARAAEDEQDEHGADEADDAARLGRCQDALRLGDRLRCAAQVAIGEAAVRQPQLLRRIGTTEEADPLEERCARR